MKIVRHKLEEAVCENELGAVDASRRQALRLGAMVPAGVLAAKVVFNSPDAAAKSATTPSPTPAPTSTPTPTPAPTSSSSASSIPVLTPWKDPLPILPTAEPVIDISKGEDLSKSAYFTKYPPNPLDHQFSSFSDFAPKKFYHHRYTECQHKFHSELPANKAWGWEGNFGGPTIKARYGEPVLIRRTNCLDPYHVGFGNPVVSTHLHNAHTPAESDGNPLVDYQVFPGQYKDYHYPNVYAGFSLNQQFAPGGEPWEAQSTLWYHDHMLDYTSQNVYMGLAGFYLMFNEYDTGDETLNIPTNFRLPSGEYDIPLIFIDMKFDANGQRLFDLFNLDGVLGDKYTVNGKIQPYHLVANRKYRFRLLNSGPSRFYNFTFSNKMPFQLIAMDGNLLPTPITLTSITLAPAERADIVVNFSSLPVGAGAASSVYLLNTLEQVNGRGPTGKTLAAPNQLIRFDVNRSAADPSQVPAKFYPLPGIPAAKLALSGLTSLKTSTKADRTFLFDRSNGAWTVNGKIYDPLSVSAIIPLNSEEVWEIQGSGDWSHPVHIHFEEFRILSRNGLPPPAQESGRKDVIYLHPGEKVRIFMRFRDFHGRFVMHCHNVVHEDHAMMVNWIIGEADPVDASGGMCTGKDISSSDYVAVFNGILT
jgi:FtsP/CotA-like multicopper oxidase with cupredoxin domain